MLLQGNLRGDCRRRKSDFASNIIKFFDRVIWEDF